MRFTITIAAAVLITAQGTSLAQEWTRFRGPNGSGIGQAATVPASFTSSDFNWKIAVPGVGHSSPVLWGRKLFITSADEAAGKRYAFCIDSADGKIIWQKIEEFKPYSHHPFNTCASSSPTVDENQVYFLWATPDAVVIQSFDHNGKEIWKREIGKLAIQHGIGTSPIVVGDVLMFGVYQEEAGPDGFLIGLDKKTGQTLWKKPRNRNPSASYATPFVLQQAGSTQPEAIFASTAHGITSLDPKTGDTNWETDMLGKLRTVACPVLANGIIFQVSGQGDGAKEAVAVKPGKKGGASPSVAYRLSRGPAYVPTPIFANGLLFAWGDSGIVTCLKPDTGEEVWKERVSDDKFFGSPVCINNRLCAMSAKGELVVIEASDKFKLVSKVDLGEQSHSTPAVANGALYLRTQSHLISVGGKK